MFRDLALSFFLYALFYSSNKENIIIEKERKKERKKERDCWAGFFFLFQIFFFHLFLLFSFILLRFPSCTSLLLSFPIPNPNLFPIHSSSSPLCFFLVYLFVSCSKSKCFTTDAYPYVRIHVWILHSNLY